MARRTRRRFTKRRIAHRMKRRFKSRRSGMRSRKMRRPPIMKQRRRVKGWKGKINNRPEMKWTTYQNLAQLNITNWVTGPGVVIWKNIGRDATPQNYFRMPASGSGPGQAVGRTFNLYFAELSFTLITRQSALPDVDAQDDMFRLYLIKAKQQELPLDTATIFRNTSWGASINTKNWDVQMDKIWGIHTGYDSNAAAGTAYFNASGQIPRFQHHKFIIPLKDTMIRVDNNDTADQVFFPDPMFLVGVAKLNTNVFACVDIACNYFYTDE